MIVGVDYSISCPCICILDPSREFSKSKFLFLSNRKRDVTAGNSHIKVELHKPFTTEQERYDHISNSMVHFITSNASEHPHVFIEDYAMGAKGKVFNIAENTGLFKHKLHQLNISMTFVPPTVLKKFATGKGNADKAKMYEAFTGRGNPSIMLDYFDENKSKVDSPVSDIVDAYFMALYGVEITHGNSIIPKGSNIKVAEWPKL
jgi:Holliday junction resolvasome RuvABC endonuclease subunit